MKNSITIDGVEYRLTRIEPEKPKVPTWKELDKSGPYELRYNLDFPDKYTEKVKVFIRLLEVVDYLNEGWDPKREDLLITIYCNNGKLETGCANHGHGVVPFMTHNTALRAIEIFRANGDEQELINFLTK